MAQKKRKAALGVSPQSSPVLSASAKRRNVALPALGALTLIAAWLAALGGVADGTLDWRQIFNRDTIYFHLVFRDAFLIDGYSTSDWIWGASPYFFPEFFLQWPAAALGADFRAVLYAFPLAQVALAATGWMFCCDFLYGKRPVRRAAVWLLHALAFLVLAWRGGDMLGLHFISGWHYGAWATLPWLLWLSLRALEDDLSSRKSRLALAGMFALLAIAAASDLVIVPWFVVPAAAAALLTTRRNRDSCKALTACLAALAAGTALGPVLSELSDVEHIRIAAVRFSFNPELTVRAVEILADILRRMAADNGLEAVVWVLFVAVALWRLFVVFPRLDVLRRGGKEGGAFHPLFGVPPGRAHRFCAVFVPASAAAAVGAVLATGNLHPFPWAHPALNVLGRHFLPFFYFPLFVGWALLPWNFSRLSFRPAPLVFAASAVVILLAAPKALSIDRAGLAPFATPFQQCFAESAKRLKWRAGVGALDANLLTANPAAGVKGVMEVVVNRDGGQARVMANPWSINLDYYRADAFQFVVVNLFNGRLFGRPPRAQDKGCAPTYPEHLDCQQAIPYVLDDATARNVFGEPAEVIDCAGVGLFHYDPPLRFDTPESREQMLKWELRPLP